MFPEVQANGISSQIIRKPATSTAAELQEFRTKPSLSDEEIAELDTFLLDASEQAGEYYQESITAIREERWTDAEIARQPWWIPSTGS
ncbi:MAG: hypothetical protein AAF449_24150 [Myxococcota bacterium]